MRLRAARLSALVSAVLLVAGLTILPTAPAAADEPLDRQQVHRFLADYVHRHGLSGAEAAVVKDGKLVYQTGAGEGDAITARTPMAIASVSKVITAFAVLQLVDADKIKLDDRVVELLPEFTMDDPRGKKITIRQLLSHTSGLPNPVLVPPAHSLRQRVAQLREMALSKDPGSGYLYSNLGYQLAARMVEVVSGESFGDYLNRHIFTPLGMRDSYPVLSGSDRPGMRDGHVTAYGTVLSLRELNAMNAGSGGLVSTAHDLALFLAMQQSGGVASDGTRMLSRSLVEEAFKRQPAAGETCLGWVHTAKADPARIGKDGSLTRYSSRIDLVPSSGYGVVVLLNSFTPTFKHPFAISTGIIDITEGERPELGAPVPTIIDRVLGLISLGWAALTVRGALRARRWADRRRAWPRWRIGLRMLPQLIMPIAAVVLFLVLPQVHHNSATSVDAFGLWPAAMILLLTAAVGGLVLTVLRLRHAL